jgi:hypothetical protein
VCLKSSRDPGQDLSRRTANLRVPTPATHRSLQELCRVENTDVEPGGEARSHPQAPFKIPMCLISFSTSAVIHVTTVSRLRPSQTVAAHCIGCVRLGTGRAAGFPCSSNWF